MTVSIRGPGLVQTGGLPLTYTATIDNSSSTHHLVYWLERTCWKDSETCDPFSTIAQGQDVLSVTFPMPAEAVWLNVEAQVRDYPVTPYATAASDTATTLGPRFNDAFVSVLKCTLPDNFFPFDEFDSLGTPTGRHFRFDPCKGVKLFDSPDTTKT